MIRAYWERFLDWITRRRHAESMIRLLGPVRGRVQHVVRIRGSYIVITDYDVYEVYYDAGFGLRRMR